MGTSELLGKPNKMLGGGGNPVIPKQGVEVAYVAGGI